MNLLEQEALKEKVRQDRINIEAAILNNRFIGQIALEYVVVMSNLEEFQVTVVTKYHGVIVSKKKE